MKWLIAFLIFLFLFGAAWLVRPKPDHSIKVIDRAELLRELDNIDSHRNP